MSFTTEGSVWHKPTLSPRLKLRVTASRVADAAYATYFWGRTGSHLVYVCGREVVTIAFKEFDRWAKRTP